MKRAKGTDSWRGGRGRARCRYYIFPKDLSLVRWNDGSYEWITDDTLLKTSNRLRVWNVRGHNTFSTRRAAERAISKIPCHEVELSRHWRRREKHWVYPPSTTRESPAEARVRDPKAGVVVTFKCQVRLYHFTDAGDLNDLDGHLADKSSFGIVIATEGSISQVLVNERVEWVESRFLVPAAV